MFKLVTIQPLGRGRRVAVAACGGRGSLDAQGVQGVAVAACGGRGAAGRAGGGWRLAAARTARGLLPSRAPRQGMVQNYHGNT